MKTNNLVKIFFGLAVFGLTFTACGDDDDDTATPAPATNNNGGGSGTATDDSTFTAIATDVSGDAKMVGNPQVAGLDATGLSFRYDSINDNLVFRIKVADMSIASGDPSFDMSFQLPGANDASEPKVNSNAGTSSMLSDKFATFYAEQGGTPPSSYTFDSNFPTGISYTNNVGTNDICSSCLDVSVSTGNNWITVTIDRKNIITDTEFPSGSNTATIKVVVNTGNRIQNADTIGDGSGDDFTFTK